MGMILNSSKHSGFTLVEMAMAMIIIGLVIGGILGAGKIKENAEVMDIIKGIALYESSAIKFKQIYGELPGDLRDPSARLTNCNAVPCSRAGNGDGALDIALAATAAYTVTNERFVFWNHLLSAGLITGFRGTDTLAFGEGLPAISEKGGGFSIFYSASAGFGGWPYSAGRPYHALAFSASAIGASPVGWNATIKNGMVEKIDKKIDDGLAIWGKVQCGLVGTCTTLAPTASIYDVDHNTLTNIFYLTKF